MGVVPAGSDDAGNGGLVGQPHREEFGRYSIVGALRQGDDGQPAAAAHLCLRQCSWPLRRSPSGSRRSVRAMALHARRRSLTASVRGAPTISRPVMTTFKRVAPSSVPRRRLVCNEFRRRVLVSSNPLGHWSRCWRWKRWVARHGPSNSRCCRRRWSSGGNGVLSDRRSGTRGRPRPLDLGYVQPHAGRYRKR